MVIGAEYYPYPIHKIGDTLKLCAMPRFGDQYADLKDWRVSSRLIGDGVDHLFDCSLEISDGKTLVVIRVAPEEQSAWEPCVAAMDIRFESSSGDVYHSNSVKLQLLKPITGT